MNLMDFANDDNFASCWVSSPAVKEPWWSVYLDPGTQVGMVVVTEGPDSRLGGFSVDIFHDGTWSSLDGRPQAASQGGKVHILRFPSVPADAVKVRFSAWDGPLSIAEIGVY